MGPRALSFNLSETQCLYWQNEANKTYLIAGEGGGHEMIKLIGVCKVLVI